MISYRPPLPRQASCLVAPTKSPSNIGLCSVAFGLAMFSSQANMTIAQVLRYTALGLGVLYGFSHQRKISATQKAETAKQEYEHKESLIQKAKAEYARLNRPVAAGNGGMLRLCATAKRMSSTSPVSWNGIREPILTSMPVIRDPMDPNFDLETFLNNLEKESP